WPGSEGNLASDNESNTTTVGLVPPQEKSEQPTDKQPARESAAPAGPETEKAEKPEKIEKPEAAEKPAVERPVEKPAADRPIRAERTRPHADRSSRIVPPLAPPPAPPPAPPAPPEAKPAPEPKVAEARPPEPKPIDPRPPVAAAPP